MILKRYLKASDRFSPPIPSFLITPPNPTINVCEDPKLKDFQDTLAKIVIAGGKVSQYLHLKIHQELIWTQITLFSFRNCLKIYEQILKDDGIADLR